MAKEKNTAAWLALSAVVAEAESLAADAHMSMMCSREAATSLLRTRETMSLPREWRRVRLLNCIMVDTNAIGVVVLGHTQQIKIIN